MPQPVTPSTRTRIRTRTCHGAGDGGHGHDPHPEHVHMIMTVNYRVCIHMDPFTCATTVTLDGDTYQLHSPPTPPTRTRTPTLSCIVAERDTRDEER